MDGFFIQLILVIAISIPLFYIARRLYLRKKNIAPPPGREIALCLFVAFTLGLVSLLLRPVGGFTSFSAMLAEVTFRLQAGYKINLRPFATIGDFIHTGLTAHYLINITANLTMFMPIGFCLPLFWKRWQSTAKMIGVGLAFPVLIEFTQLFIGRAVDIDDVLVNFLGILLGYGLYKLSAAKFRPAQAWAL